MVTIMQDSHGIMYGAPKYLRKSLFWYGQQLWETLDNLIKRGFNLVNWCCMCRCNNKTVDHLLIHCAVAQELWTFIFAMFGVQWVMSRRSLMHLLAGEADMPSVEVLLLMWIVWG